MPDALEPRLRRIELKQPDAAARERLLTQARRRQGTIRRGRALRWVLAMMIGALIAINVAFERSHTARIAALTGPRLEPALTGEQYVAAMRQTSEMLSQMLEPNGQR